MTDREQVRILPRFDDLSPGLFPGIGVMLPDEPLNQPNTHRIIHHEISV